MRASKDIGVQGPDTNNSWRVKEKDPWRNQETESEQGNVRCCLRQFPGSNTATVFYKGGLYGACVELLIYIMYLNILYYYLFYIQSTFTLQLSVIC